jgi:hypothetical protein
MPLRIASTTSACESAFGRPADARFGFDNRDESIKPSLHHFLNRFAGLQAKYSVFLSGRQTDPTKSPVKAKQQSP